MTARDKELVRQIEEWFDQHADDPQIWRTPVGRALQACLKKRDNWKNAARGNPKRAGKASQAAHVCDTPKGKFLDLDSKERLLKAIGR